LVKLYAEALDRYVEILEEPMRIVSLAPAITETLYMLGLEDTVNSNGEGYWVDSVTPLYKLSKYCKLSSRSYQYEVRV